MIFISWISWIMCGVISLKLLNNNFNWKSVDEKVVLIIFLGPISLFIVLTASLLKNILKK